MKQRQPFAIAWDSRVPSGISIATGVPGAVVELVERTDGVIEGRNGAGSVVELIYPYGVQGADFDGWDY
jgi:hypothetical protein